MSQNILWYSVTQAPPKKSERYLITDGMEVSIGVWDTYEQEFSHKEPMTSDPLYWSHLPHPPKKLSRTRP